MIVLQLEYGTNLFAKTLECFSPFWGVVTALTKVAMHDCRGGGDKPVVLTMLVKEADKSHATVKKAVQKGWFVSLTEFNETLCHEYAALYMGVQKEMVPSPVQSFVSKVSLGNPLYIRETIDQLVANGHIQILRDAAGSIE